MTLRYLAIDPGDTTGWAEFLDDRPIGMGEIPYIDMPEWLRQTQHPECKHVIVENYRIRPVPMTKGHANTWSEVKPIRVIGMVLYWAYLQDIEVVFQDPSILEIGYGMAGMKYVKTKKGDITHMLDAVAHGYYWWFNRSQRRGGTNLVS